MIITIVGAAGNCQLVVDSDVVNTPTTWTFTYRPGGANLAQSKSITIILSNYFHHCSCYEIHIFLSLRYHADNSNRLYSSRRHNSL